MKSRRDKSRRLVIFCQNSSQVFLRLSEKNKEITMTKSIFLSKTFWANFIIAVLASLEVAGVIDYLTR